jgi:putative phosphotransacetylase
MTSDTGGLDMSCSGKRSFSVPTGISARHVHVSCEHFKILFGEDCSLTKVKDLSQPGQYASNEFVDIIGPKGSLTHVRILGPTRKETQVEISKTDSFKLGVTPPVRDSGNLDGSPGIILRGPKGEVEIDKGVILAMRHIHMTPEDAEKFGVYDSQIVQVEVKGPRALIFKEVIIRVKNTFALDFHIDTDEANAAGLNTGDIVDVWVD